MTKTIFPPIFIISLKHSGRREFISDRLSSLGLRFQFIDAVYGKDLTDEDLSKVDFEFYPQRFGSKKPLTKGELGCALSHIGIYEKMVKENIPEAIILEDDAIVNLYFPEILKEALEKLPKRAEMLFLDHGKAKVFPLMRSLPERYRLARYLTPSKNSKRTITCTAAYYLKLEGAKKLLSKAYPLRLPADYLTGLLQLTGVHAYGIEPACSTSGHRSQIDDQGNRYD